ncbi:hypothetical protein HUJ04_011130 [Dendroctonus ponderosae]|nr:hypothetical protein HUJ04_011130 [Dendroctonus ponderosae]
MATKQAWHSFELETLAVVESVCADGDTEFTLTKATTSAKRSIQAKPTEHKRDTDVKAQMDKSALTEQMFTRDNHAILVEETQVMDRGSRYYPRIFRKAIEHQKHMNNFSRKDQGLYLIWQLSRRGIVLIRKLWRLLNQYVLIVVDADTEFTLTKATTSAGSIYIGTRNRSIQAKPTEHKKRLAQMDKSALAEQIFTRDNHVILVEETQVMDRGSQYYPRIFREAIELQKHMNNFSRKDQGLNLSKTLKPALQRT